MNWSELSHLLPIGVVLTAVVIVVFLDLVLPKKDRYILPWIAFSGCMLALVSIFHTQHELVRLFKSITWFVNYDALSDTHATNSVILGGAFCLDQFALFIWIIACIAGGLSVLSATHSDEESALVAGEYYGLMLLAVAGMMLLAVSHDFLTLLISLEIMSISTYILTGSNRDDIRSNEAALKYLVLGAFSTAFLLMGIAFYYGAFGTLSLTPNVSFMGLPKDEYVHRQLFIIIAMGLILVGSLFKVGASPFHFWIPDVYEGAPTAVTSLMAVGVKAAAFAVVARLAFESFGAADLRAIWVPLLQVIAVLTMVIGNVLAMRQNNVKRMLAYSGIAHTGYLLLAFLVRPGTDAAEINEHLKAVVFYLLTYGVMTLGAFGVVGLIRDDGRPLQDMDSYEGLAKEHPGLALCMAIFMLSLAGMPPMGGFFAKFLIFKGAVDQGFVVASVLGILTSVASLYYYLRVIVAMYMSPANADAAEASLTPHCQYAWGSNLLIYVAGIVTLIIGVLPGWFYLQ